MEASATDPVSQSIERLKPWFHNIHLPGEVQTAPEHFLGDFPSFKWKKLAPHLPQDLSGWSILDIGCNAGFYSFELARRGARVTGIDADPHYLEQARWVSTQLELEGNVEFRQMQIYDLARESEIYDLILFMGVFYHLRYPMLGLDIVAQRVKRLLVFQTLSTFEQGVRTPPPDLGFLDRRVLDSPDWPKMAFLEHRLAGDPTNWFVPNKAGCEAMLRSAGLKVLGHPLDETYLCEPDPDHPSVMTTWNRDEYLSATFQQP